MELGLELGLRRVWVGVRLGLWIDLELEFGLVRVGLGTKVGKSWGWN